MMYKDSLLDTIAVEDRTAKGLYQTVEFLLEKRGISFNNIVGFGGDNCSSMIDELIISGFKNLLKDDVPSIFVMSRICHSMALCASYAVNVLKSYLEAFFQDITLYFSRNSKRRRIFMAI